MKHYSREQEKQNLLKENASEYDCEVFTIERITIARIQKKQAKLDAIERKQREQEMSEYAKWEKEAIKHLGEVRVKILQAINNLNANVTIDNLFRVESLLGFYSDYHKDIYSYRPHYEIGYFYDLFNGEAETFRNNFRANPNHWNIYCEWLNKQYEK